MEIINRKAEQEANLSKKLNIKVYILKKGSLGESL